VRKFLGDIAHGKSGDKGNTSNIGVIAWRPEYYEQILDSLEPKRIARHFGDNVQGDVRVHRLPNVYAANVILTGALDGGGTRSLRLDAQGKLLCEALFSLPLVETGSSSDESTNRWENNGMNAETDGQEVALTIDGAVATITLNEPDKRNRLSQAMAQQLVRHLTDLQHSPEVSCVIITGAGSAFCAGGDVKRMTQVGGAPIDLARHADDLHNDEYQAAAHRAVLLVTQLEKPVIAAVNGPAMGWGCDLSLACDIRLASDNATFGEVFVRRGAVPDGGSSYLLPRIIGMGRAAELLLTGRVIDATEADRIGMVNHIYPSDMLLAEAQSLADEIVAFGAPLALQLTKRALYSHSHGNGHLADALREVMYMNHICSPSRDHAEAAAAFLEGRTPQYIRG